MREAFGCLTGVLVGFLLGYMSGSWFLSVASTPSGTPYDSMEVAIFGLFGAMAGAILGGSVGVMATRD